MAGEPQRDLYYVAVKAFVRDGQKLLITKDIFGDWDLPGGRIRDTEFEASLESILKRKMGEELGQGFKYSPGEPVIFMRHERNEATLEGKPKVRIFAVGFECQYGGGEVDLGEYHAQYEWVDVKSFQPSDYFSGGWLKGVQEYLQKARHA